MPGRGSRTKGKYGLDLGPGGLSDTTFEAAVLGELAVISIESPEVSLFFVFVFFLLLLFLWVRDSLPFSPFFFLREKFCLKQQQQQKPLYTAQFRTTACLLMHFIPVLFEALGQVWLAELAIHCLIL